MVEITQSPIQYRPFLQGRHSTSPSLKPVKYVPHRPESHIFQIDKSYGRYIRNKHRLRAQRVEKYYCAHQFSERTAEAVCKFIIDRTLLESSQYFEYGTSADGTVLTNRITADAIEYNREYRYTGSKYLSLFDALSMQHQEDMAVLQLDTNKDWLAALHIFAPNFWSPEDKIGRDFSAIHGPVPDMEKVKKHYRPLIEHIIESDGIFERFGWGIAADDELDHLGGRADVDSQGGGSEGIVGHGSRRTPFIRTERQVLVGLRSVRALLFTIRTYLQPVDTLNEAELLALEKAVRSMSDNMIKYKDIGNKMDKFLGKLS